MQELMNYRNWVVTYIANKIPLHPITGKNADVNDPSTWSDYATAAAACHYNNLLTLGFVLTNSPFACVDLDTHRTTDQGIINTHKQIYEYFDTYSELSPNRGVHIWCKGDLPTGKKLPSQFIEVYTTSRYITITRLALNAKPIESRQVQLEEIYKSIDLEKYSASPHVADSLPEVQSDEEICMQASRALNGRLFMDLWVGQWEQYYKTQSEADQSLCNIISYYTESKEQAARIFHQSELGRRKKARRLDYLYSPKYGLITKAWDQKLPRIRLGEIPKIIGNGQAHPEALRAISVSTPYISETAKLARKIDKLPTFVQKDFDFAFEELPPGLIGEMAQFIYRNAVRPVREIAISGAVAFLAGICGRSYNISSTGLNHYIVILAPTGGGKEGAVSGIERLAMHIKASTPEIDMFMGPADIASPQALVRKLSESPCFLSHRGEMGFWLNKLCHRFAKSNETSLRGLLLDLFTKSGNGQMMRGSIYADTNKNIPNIVAPAFSLFGDATPDRFYEALDEENVEEGLVSRFTVIEASPEKAPFNVHHDSIIPDEDMIRRLINVVKNSASLNKSDAVITIQEQPDATTAHMEFERECYERTVTPDQLSEAKLYSRAHLRLLRLAGLIAVGVNPDCPVLTVEMVEWAKKFIVHGIAKVALRFAEGDVGEVNLYIQQRKALKLIIRKYLADGWNQRMASTYAINKEMFDARIVTYRYLNHRMTGYAAFRKAHNFSIEAKNIINELCESGILVKLDMGRVRDSPRQGFAYYIHDVGAINDENRN